MTKFQSPNVPFVEACFVGSKHRPTAIVLDLSMTTSDKGAALGVASNLHRPNGPSKSFHYLVDEAETYRGVWDNYATYGSPHRAISVLVCSQPVEQPSLWEENREVMNRAAYLVADLCLAHKIKPRYLHYENLERWLKRRSRRNGGIFVRAPGVWPSFFFDKVTGHINDRTS